VALSRKLEVNWRDICYCYLAYDHAVMQQPLEVSRKEFRPTGLACGPESLFRVESYKINKLYI